MESEHTAAGRLKEKKTEMPAVLLSFTAEGEKQSDRIGIFLRKSGYEVLQEHFGGAGSRPVAEVTECHEGTWGRPASEMTECREGATEKDASPSGQPEKISAKDFVSRMFPRTRLLIFVGACGIAVRMIAPHVRDKKTDPAVLVVDERGQFVIPLLSGHLGGANRYARQIAEVLGATAVITTATDIEGRFAPDLFAEKYQLSIRSMEDAKAVAAAGLKQDVKICIGVPWKGVLPEEPGAFCIYCCDGEINTVEEHSPLKIEDGCMKKGGGEEFQKEPGEKSRKEPAPCILVTNAEIPEILGLPQCTLTPKNLIIGIGCRRGTEAGKIISFLRELLRERNLSASAIRCFASIDLKKDEAGILEASEAFHVPFYTFSAGLLNTLPGDFTPSEFVKNHTGTDNVCERSAAMAAIEQGRFLARKQAKDGVTLAVYEVPVSANHF